MDWTTTTECWFTKLAEGDGLSYLLIWNCQWRTWTTNGIRCLPAMPGSLKTLRMSATPLTSSAETSWRDRKSWREPWVAFWMIQRTLRDLTLSPGLWRTPVQGSLDNHCLQRWRMTWWLLAHMGWWNGMVTPTMCEKLRPVWLLSSRMSAKKHPTTSAQLEITAMPRTSGILATLTLSACCVSQRWKIGAFQGPGQPLSFAKQFYLVRVTSRRITWLGFATQGLEATLPLLTNTSRFVRRFALPWFEIKLTSRIWCPLSIWSGGWWSWRLQWVGILRHRISPDWTLCLKRRWHRADRLRLLHWIPGWRSGSKNEPISRNKPDCSKRSMARSKRQVSRVKRRRRGGGQTRRARRLKVAGHQVPGS